MSYFKPLRRKLGAVTLVMACVFAAGWVRSRSTEDSIGLTISSNRLVWILSLNSQIGLAVNYGRFGNFWRSQSLADIELDFEGYFVSGSGYRLGGRRNLTTGEIDRDVVPQQLSNGNNRYPVLVPYWRIALPLALLSAGLLLSTPRQLKLKSDLHK